MLLATVVGGGGSSWAAQGRLGTLKGVSGLSRKSLGVRGRIRGCEDVLGG